jgi:hypothetical protein
VPQECPFVNPQMRGFGTRGFLLRLPAPGEYTSVALGFRRLVQRLPVKSVRFRQDCQHKARSRSQCVV